MYIGEEPQLILTYRNFSENATENPLTCRFFSGASENENVGNFPHSKILSRIKDTK